MSWRDRVATIAAVAFAMLYVIDSSLPKTDFLTNIDWVSAPCLFSLHTHAWRVGSTRQFVQPFLRHVCAARLQDHLHAASCTLLPASCNACVTCTLIDSVHACGGWRGRAQAIILTTSCLVIGQSHPFNPQWDGNQQTA